MGETGLSLYPAASAVGAYVCLSIVCLLHGLFSHTNNHALKLLVAKWGVVQVQ